MAALTVRLLRSTTPGHVPGALQSGQLAINEADGKLFWLDGNGSTIRSVTLKDLDAIVAAKANAANVPGKDGAGASGTWPISVTGSAASATNATNATNAGNADTLDGIHAAGFLRPDATAAISKGYTVSPANLGNMGTFTVDPSLGNYQFGTNVGGITIAAPASDCAVDILITNSASAGAITMSGFVAAANGGGDVYAATNGARFLLLIRRIGGVATYAWKALQ